MTKKDDITFIWLTFWKLTPVIKNIDFYQRRKYTMYFFNLSSHHDTDGENSSECDEKDPLHNCFQIEWILEISQYGNGLNSDFIQRSSSFRWYGFILLVGGSVYIIFDIFCWKFISDYPTGNWRLQKKKNWSKFQLTSFLKLPVEQLLVTFKTNNAVCLWISWGLSDISRLPCYVFCFCLIYVSNKNPNANKVGVAGPSDIGLWNCGGNCIRLHGIPISNPIYADKLTSKLEE